jgi:hypothetical protein
LAIEAHTAMIKKAMVYFGIDNKAQSLKKIGDNSKSVLANYEQSVLVEF